MRRRLCILLIAAWSAGIPCDGRGQEANRASIDGLEIGITIRTNDHPALGKPFVDRLHERVAEVLMILLGDKVSVVRENTPNLGEWLQTHTLSELTVGQCIQFGLVRHPKEILVDLRYERGNYHVSVLEYDGSLQALGSVRTDRVAQRAMAADLVAHLVLQSWSPVGEIVRRRGQEFEIEIQGLARLMQVPEWSGIRPGTVFQLYSEVHNRNQPPVVSQRDDQFLIVKESNAGMLTARLALPEPSGSSWFSQLGNPRVRYLARRVVADGSPINVRVTLQESESPREGCFVYASSISPQPPEQLGEMLGTTAGTGQLPTPFVASGLRYVTVAYEDLTETRLVVPGVTASPLRFRFPARGSQTACQLKVDRLKNELSDNSSLLNIRLKDVESADKALDVEKAEEAAIAANKLRNAIVALRDHAETLRQSPDTCDPESLRQLANVVASADELLARYQGVGDSVKVIQVKLLQREIDAAWREHRWTDVRDQLAEYVTLKREIGEPDRREEDRLNELNQALSITDVAHLQARTRLERSVGIDQIDDLENRWSEIRDALNLLVQRRDHFWLRKIYGEFSTWSSLLSEERKRQDALRQSQTLSLEQKEELLAQMKSSEGITDEFRNLVGPVARVIQEADRSYQP